MELILRTTAVFGAAFLLSALLRRAAPASRHLLWHVTMLIVVAAPLVMPFAPRFQVPAWPISSTMLSASFGTSKEVPYGVKEAPYGVAQRSFEAVGHHFSGAEPGSADASTGTATTAPSISLIALWTSGSMLVGLWFLSGWLASLLIGRRATGATGALDMELRSIARELRVKRIPELRLITGSHGPLTVGIFRPVILLPMAAAPWSVDRRRAVLAHELAHVRRADTRTQALAHVACALYWFNPLAWMAARALRRERERACDDAVLALGVRPSSYADDLLAMARAMNERAWPTAALAMARRSELEGRLLSVLTDRRRQPAGATKWALSAAMTLSAAIALGGQSGVAQTSQFDRVTNHPSAAPWLFNDGRDAQLQEQRRNDTSAQALAQSDDDDTRERAALSLALSGDASAIDGLIAALDDASGQVREKAALGLARQSDVRVIEPLLRALRDSDPQVREKSAIGLMLRRDPRVVPALLIAVEDTDSQVREKAVMALGTSGDARAIAPLEHATHDPDAQVRDKAAVALKLLGGGW